jgi:hypothetical protein
MLLRQLVNPLILGDNALLGAVAGIGVGEAVEAAHRRVGGHLDSDDLAEASSQSLKVRNSASIGPRSRPWS